MVEEMNYIPELLESLESLVGDPKLALSINVLKFIIPILLFLYLVYYRYLVTSDPNIYKMKTSLKIVLGLVFVASTILYILSYLSIRAGITLALGLGSLILVLGFLHFEVKLFKEVSR